VASLFRVQGTLRCAGLGHILHSTGAYITQRHKVIGLTLTLIFTLIDEEDGSISRQQTSI
jgi:hypothetical protein